MPKRRVKRKNSPNRRSKRSAYSSRVDGHPLFTALFIVFCVIIAALAIFTLALHRLGEEADEHMMISQHPTPAVTISPYMRSSY